MSRYNTLAGSEVIDANIENMAKTIVADYPETPLFVALLRGAAPFASQLMSAIAKLSPDYHPELDYMMVSTYGGGQHAGQPHIVTDLAPTTLVTGRTVVIVDDVLDKGVTAEFVFSHLEARGAQALKLAVLCDKQTTRTAAIEADYKAFTFADNWLVGMGMDDASEANEGYRWLHEIWEIRR